MKNRPDFQSIKHLTDSSHFHWTTFTFHNNFLIIFLSKVNYSTMLSLLAMALMGVSSAYKIGTGIYDITGPSVEINFMVSVVRFAVKF